MRVDCLWRNARLMTMRDDGLGLVVDGLVAARGGRILYADRAAAAPPFDAVETIDCAGRWITPGLIDCHTHLVFGGDRAGEWQARLAGADYATLAKTGGIRATVAATGAADVAGLVDAALPRLDRMAEDGVTTVEIKSGYGLTQAAELNQLAAARALGRVRPMRIVATLLAAHAIPSGMTETAYLETVALPLVALCAQQGLADAVDAFLERIAFSEAAVARVFAAAHAAGLPLRLHADQLSDGSGAALAARWGAKSADHLEYAAESGIAAMARAGTVAVLLPGAFLTLGETQRPPVAACRLHGTPIAVATDCNPGSSPLLSLLAALTLGCDLFGLTIIEALRGATVNAARALGRDDIGRLVAGARADLAIWSVEQPAELLYWLGARPLWRREFGG